MSQYDIRPKFECRTRILNVKITYSASVRMSESDCECQNTIFGPISRVKKDFECHNTVCGPCSNVKIGF